MRKEILAEDFINSHIERVLKESGENEIDIEMFVDKFMKRYSEDGISPIKGLTREEVLAGIEARKAEEGKFYGDLIDTDWLVDWIGTQPIRESVEDLTEKRHRARLIDPSKFKTFRTDKNKGGKGVDFVYGIRKKEGERGGKTELQAITFDSEEFSTKQAKIWLKKNKKDAKFTPASVKESVKTYENLFVEKANSFMDEKFLVEDIENFEDEYVEEAQEDDAFITDNTRGGYDTSCSGKFLGNFREYDDAVIAIGDCMKDSNWFPNVWNVNERGSMDLISDFDAIYKKALKDRAQVKAEDEIEYELEKSYEEE